MCLPELDHNWPRYVMPAGAALSLSDGFLPDPDGHYERYSNPGLLTTQEFFHQRCCVLLGDTGIGKSNVLFKERAQVLTTAQRPENVIFRSLRDFGSDATAAQFLASPEIEAWVGDEETELFLFLDSLDEALLKVDTWASLLGSALAKWPLDRLWLRITCRPPYATSIARLGMVFCCCLTLRYVTWRPTNVLDLQYLFYAPFGMVFVSQDRLHRQLWPATTTSAEFVWGAHLKEDLKRYVEAREAAAEARDPEQPWRSYMEAFTPDNSLIARLHAKFLKPRTEGVASGPTGDFELLPEDVKRQFREAMELIDEQDRQRGGRPGERS